MSRSLNKVQLIGNLGKDPEVRSTASGTRVATLSIATSRQWKNASGEAQEKTEWHRVVLWNNRGSGLADVVERYLKKGDRVYIEGRIEYRTWEDRDGNTRYTTEIIGREMMMLSGRSGSSEAGMETAGAAVGQTESAEQGSEAFKDFPEALDEEDDDLPF
ncbi:MAG: single-stranded DNA-binding protein [Acidimicrobiia bacterium]